MKVPTRFSTPMSSAICNTALCITGSALVIYAWRKAHHREQKFSRRHPQLHMDESVILYARPQDLFAYWKELRALPELVPTIESITPTGTSRHRWIIKTPHYQSIEWETEVFRQEDDRLIAWQSTPDSPINSRGSIWFSPQGSGRTQMRLILQFQHNGSPQSRLLASAIKGATAKTLRANLAHFKESALELFVPARSPKQENL